MARNAIIRQRRVASLFIFPSDFQFDSFLFSRLFHSESFFWLLFPYLYLCKCRKVLYFAHQTYEMAETKTSRRYANWKFLLKASFCIWRNVFPSSFRCCHQHIFILYTFCSFSMKSLRPFPIASVFIFRHLVDSFWFSIKKNNIEWKNIYAVSLPLSWTRIEGKSTHSNWDFFLRIFFFALKTENVLVISFHIFLLSFFLTSSFLISFCAVAVVGNLDVMQIWFGHAAFLGHRWICTILCGKYRCRRCNENCQNAQPTIHRVRCIVRYKANSEYLQGKCCCVVVARCGNISLSEEDSKNTKKRIKLNFLNVFISTLIFCAIKFGCDAKYRSRPLVISIWLCLAYRKHAKIMQNG